MSISINNINRNLHIYTSIMFKKFMESLADYDEDVKDYNPEVFEPKYSSVEIKFIPLPK